MSNNFLTADALGNPVTFRTTDTGNGIQSSQVIPSDITGTPFSHTNAFPVDGSGVIQPVSMSSLPLPAGAALAAKQPALGIAGTASADVLTVQGAPNMVPLLVTLSSGSITVTGSGGSTVPSGTAGTASSEVLSVQGITGMTPLLVNGSAVTQPVSIAQPLAISNIPLPPGAAIAAKQPALGLAGTPSSDVLTVQGTSSMTPLKVDGSTVTQPVSWSSQSVSLSGTLPAFAAIPTINLGTVGGAATAAAQTVTNSTLASILTAVQAQRSDSLWTDNSGTYYVRSDAGGSITWTTVSGNVSSAPGTGARPADGSSSGGLAVDRQSYIVTSSGSGQYNVGDYLDHIVTANATGTLLGSFWLDITTSTVLSAPPTLSNISPVSVLPTGAATAANQTSNNQILTTINTGISGVGTGVTQLHSDLTTLNTAAGTTNTNIAQIHTDLSGTLKTATQTNASRQTISGILTNPGDTVVLAVDGMSTVVVQVATGSWLGTIQFQGSVDNTATWVSVYMTPYPNAAQVTSTTSGGLWEMPVGPFSHLRVYATNMINATASIVIAATNGLGTLNVSVNSASSSIYTTDVGTTGYDASASAAPIPMNSYVLLNTIAVNLARALVGVQNQSENNIQIVRDDGNNFNETTLLLGPYGGASGQYSWTSSTFKGRIRVYGPAGSQVAIYQD